MGCTILLEIAKVCVTHASSSTDGESDSSHALTGCTRIYTYKTGLLAVVQSLLSRNTPSETNY